MDTLMEQLGEILAVEFLRSKGYRILEKHYRNKENAIDLVAREEDLLVFIDVRTQATDENGEFLISPLSAPKHQMRQTVRDFFAERNPSTKRYRFDVISVVLKEGEEAACTLFRGDAHFIYP